MPIDYSTPILNNRFSELNQSQKSFINRLANSMASFKGIESATLIEAYRSADETLRKFDRIAW
jgi:hypothetical protein